MSLSVKRGGRVAPADLSDIVSRFRRGDSNADIALAYRMTHSNVSSIRRGKSWGDATRALGWQPERLITHRAPNVIAAERSRQACARFRRGIEGCGNKLHLLEQSYIDYRLVRWWRRRELPHWLICRICSLPFRRAGLKAPRHCAGCVPEFKAARRRLSADSILSPKDIDPGLAYLSLLTRQMQDLCKDE